MLQPQCHMVLLLVGVYMYTQFSEQILMKFRLIHYCGFSAAKAM